MRKAFILILILLLNILLSCHRNRETFPVQLQENLSECGPVCLSIVAAYYEKEFTLDQLKKWSDYDGVETSLFGLSQAGEKMGFKTLAVAVTYEEMFMEAPMPAIAHWNENHFIVVYEAYWSHVKVSDPKLGLMEYTREEFCDKWVQSAFGEEGSGILLLFEPLYKKDKEK